MPSTPMTYIRHKIDDDCLRVRMPAGRRTLSLRLNTYPQPSHLLPPITMPPHKAPRKGRKAHQPRKPIQPVEPHPLDPFRAYSPSISSAICSPPQPPRSLSPASSVGLAISTPPFIATRISTESPPSKSSSSFASQSQLTTVRLATPSDATLERWTRGPSFRSLHVQLHNMGTDPGDAEYLVRIPESYVAV